MTSVEISGRTARKSAAIVGLVLAAIALWQAYRGRQTAMYIVGGAAGVLLLAAVLSERASIRFHRAWMGLAGILGWVNSRILLTTIYIVVMTPVGWTRRLFGSDPLDRRGPKRDTYWIRRETTRPAKEQFERLF